MWLSTSFTIYESGGEGKKKDTPIERSYSPLGNFSLCGNLYPATLYNQKLSIISKVNLQIKKSKQKTNSIFIWKINFFENCFYFLFWNYELKIEKNNVLWIELQLWVKFGCDRCLINKTFLELQKFHAENKIRKKRDRYIYMLLICECIMRLFSDIP